MNAGKAKNLLVGTVLVNTEYYELGTVRAYAQDGYGAFGWMIDWETQGVKFFRLGDMGYFEIYQPGPKKSAVRS